MIVTPTAMWCTQFMGNATWDLHRIAACTLWKPITDIIQKARIPLFSNHWELKNKNQNKVKAITHDYKLKVQMLLSLICRPEQEMTDFSKHESRKYPPTLADDQGSMRIGNKSEVVSCLRRALDDNMQVFENLSIMYITHWEQHLTIATSAVETEPPDLYPEWKA